MSDLVKFKVPAEFIASRVRLHPAELAYGYHSGWIGAQDTVGLCTRLLESGEASPLEEEIALLLSDETDRVAEILRPFSQQSSGQEVETWHYLALAWAYEARSSVGDALGLVEILYADFDYPPEMEGFVRYMPPPPGAEIGNDALMSRWGAYLAEKDAYYSRRDREAGEPAGD